MPTPPLLSQNRPAPAVVDPDELRRSDPVVGLAVGFLILTVIGLIVCAVLATYGYNTSPSQWGWVIATVVAFGAGLLLVIAAAFWRHFARQSGR